MVGIVLVSHSKALALALRELVQQMAGADFPVGVAAGVGDDFAEIGTDAVHIAEVLRPYCDADGAVVLMDLGSAVLSAQTALELLEMEDVPEVAAKIRLCPAPIVEAAVAASVAAKTGGSLDAVAAEAMSALVPKESQLGYEAAAPVAPEPATPVPAGEAVEFEVTIENPHGLHARPAANLVQAAGRFQADVRLTNLTAGRGPAPARSLTGVGLLQARKGDVVRFSIVGPDAEEAAQRLRALAAERFGEAEAEVAPPPKPVAAAASGTGGVPASEGVAIGRPLALAAAIPEPADVPAATPAEERARLDAALARVAGEIRESAAAAPGDAAAIFVAQALMLSDPALLDPLHARIAAGGVSAFAAWRAESRAVADAYAAMEDEYLQARAADLRDIAARVARVLSGDAGAIRIAPEPPAILLTGELLPSEAMACDPAKVLGILAREGSPTAHAAILARTQGIPMVVGAKGLDFAAVAAARTLAIDGATGEVWIEPDAARVAEIETRRAAFVAERAAFAKAKDEPAFTLDGEAVEVLANVGNAADAAAARDNGAEGVGLLRTEFVYLKEREIPSEDRQTEALTAVLAELGDGPVVIRTPDIGADKPLAFMPQAAERNPFLGVRGLRLSFRHPAFFASNLRAILRAGIGRDLWIMFPMVASPDEMAEARALAEAAHRDLAAAGVAHAWPAKIGMMVEVPAAALTLDHFAACADFFSIGTNDLTQYVLAAERGNGDLAALQDAAHPAVLRAVATICERAAAAGRHVSVCGDAASDPLAAAAMIGVGVRSLSARPNQVAAIKAQVRRVTAKTLADLAAQALRLGTAAEVRALFAEALAAPLGR